MINWGILGLGRMGMAFANAIEETDNSKLIAKIKKYSLPESSKFADHLFEEHKKKLIELVQHNKNLEARETASCGALAGNSCQNRAVLLWSTSKA